MVEVKELEKMNLITSTYLIWQEKIMWLRPTSVSWRQDNIRRTTIYAQFLFAKQRKIVTKPSKITSIRVSFECKFLTWHKFVHNILIANIHKQFTPRNYKIKLRPKDQTYLYKTKFERLQQTKMTCTYGALKYYILHRIVHCIKW